MSLPITVTLVCCLSGLSNDMKMTWRSCPEAAQRFTGLSLATCIVVYGTDNGIDHALCGACVRVCVFNAGQFTAGLMLMPTLVPQLAGLTTQ